MAEYYIQERVRKDFKSKRLLVKKGDIFGNLTIADNNFYKTKASNHIHVKCICKCGNEVFERLDHLRKEKRNMCYTCSMTEKTGDSCTFGNVTSKMLSDLKRGAIKRNLEFSITAEYLWNLFLEQEGRCAISGIDIILEPLYYNKCKIKKREDIDRSKITASVDRINSNLGYTKDNVQWVHKLVNRMKSNLSDPDFIGFCRTVTKHNQLKEDNFEPSRLNGYMFHHRNRRSKSEGAETNE